MNQENPNQEILQDWERGIKEHYSNTNDDLDPVTAKMNYEIPESNTEAFAAGFNTAKRYWKFNARDPEVQQRIMRAAQLFNNNMRKVFQD